MHGVASEAGGVGSAVLERLPPLDGQRVVDLGCGTGEVAAALAQRRARVVGIDANPDSLRIARARALDGAEFHEADLREPLGIDEGFDGLWSTFVAAYFPDLAPALRRWSHHVKPGGWIALAEIDDLFGHEPLSARARERFDGYAREALAASRELAFDGPAPADVIDAWRARLARMTLLHERCGRDWEPIRDELLATLARSDHRSRARVVCCIARR